MARRCLISADPAIRRIVHRVCAGHGVKIDDIVDFPRRSILARRALVYALLDEAHLSRPEVARLIGVSLQLVRAYVRDHRRMTGAPAPRAASLIVDTGDLWPELLAVSFACGLDRSWRVIAAVSARWGVSAADIVGRDQSPAVSAARCAAVWWLLRLTRLSLAQIGARLGDRDHSTILYAERVHMARHGLPRARETVYDRKKAA